MEGMPAGSRRLCIAIDVKGYSHRGRVAQIDVQNNLVAVIRQASAEAGLGSDQWLVQQAGDGMLGLLPPGADDFRFLPRFLDGLVGRLASLNEHRPEPERIRIRVAVDQGVVHEADNGYVGSAVVNVKRIVDAGALRAALDARPGSHAVVAVSDHVYEDIFVDPGQSTWIGEFWRVRAATKDRRLTVWLCVPGHPPVRRRRYAHVAVAATVLTIGVAVAVPLYRASATVDDPVVTAAADRTATSAASTGGSPGPVSSATSAPSAPPVGSTPGTVAARPPSSSPQTTRPPVSTALTATVECVDAPGCRTARSTVQLRGRISTSLPGGDELRVFVQSETGAWFPTTLVTLAGDLSWAGTAGVGPSKVNRDLAFRICLFSGGAQFRARVNEIMQADPQGVSANGISPLPGGARELACASATRVP